jgi:Uma2 family endonuclease
MESPPSIHFDSFKLTDDQFYQLCQDNRDLRLERTAYGELVIMPPTGGETGNCNGEINYQLFAWNHQHKLGICFDSSTGFKLANGADRSPDASWISLEKWQNLTLKEREKFIPLSPDFVIELWSKNDSLKSLQEKMKEYMENGTKLGWLINRQDRQVEIYRVGKEVETVDHPLTLSGEDILPNFVMDLSLIWQPYTNG